MRASGEMLICKDVGAYRKGLGIEGVCLSTPREKLRSGAGQNELAIDQVLANFVAELFVILHPATLPMLERLQIPVHRGQSFRRIADSIPVIADSF